MTWPNSKQPMPAGGIGACAYNGRSGSGRMFPPLDHTGGRLRARQLHVRIVHPPLDVPLQVRRPAPHSHCLPVRLPQVMVDADTTDRRPGGVGGLVHAQRVRATAPETQPKCLQVSPTGDLHTADKVPTLSAYANGLHGGAA
jgi:hypothetical protein